MWGFAGKNKDYGTKMPSANERKIRQIETKCFPNVSPVFPHVTKGGETIKRKRKTMIRISLIYDHHQRAKKNEAGPVEVRVLVNRKPYYIQTGVRVLKNRLMGNSIVDVPVMCADGVERMTSDADLLNERLTSIVRIVDEEVNRCIDERRSIDVVAIRQKVYNLEPDKRDDDGPTLLDWIQEQAKVADITTATKKRYTTLTNKLREYGQIKRWEDLTVESIYNWDVWLRQQPVPLTENQKMAGKDCATLKQSAVYNYHKLLKAMLNRALKLGKLQANPYDRMKGSFKRGTNDVVEYLTREQMRKVMELEPVPGSQYETARDLFVFQMYTGLSYIDTQHFDMKDYRLVDGRWVFVGKRVKTGVPYVSQLLPPVVKVLERHGWQVPKMNNQRYNQMLKAIGMVIGIPRLHSHMGRHTFATWMLSEGAKIENVSRMLGHTNIVQTQRYAQVLAEDVRSEFDKVAEKMNKQ